MQSWTLGYRNATERGQRLAASQQKERSKNAETKANLDLSWKKKKKNLFFLSLSLSVSKNRLLFLQAATFQKMAPAAITKVVGRQIIDSR